MNNPLVSWLMPVYNAEATVGRAIESMLAQTYRNFELVIVVEADCTDLTYNICQRYANADDRIRIIQNDVKLGIAKSLNIGLEHCSGKYIARMDADDVSLPERLDKQVAFMENNPDCGVLGTACLAVYDDYECAAPYPETDDEIKTGLLFQSTIAHPSVMLRTEILRGHAITYPLDVAEDYALWVELASKTKMANLPDILVKYNRSDEQRSATNHAAVRRSSADISRRAIKKMLGIDTENYQDRFVGWRGEDAPPADAGEYLRASARLLREIEAANAHLKVFDEECLLSQLRTQWVLAKEQICISCLPLGYDGCDFQFCCSITDRYLEMCTRRLRGKRSRVLLYGTGAFCEYVMKTPEPYPFEIIGICDSNPAKAGTALFGKKVIASADIDALDFDYILISTPRYASEIYRYLTDELLIQKEKILPYLAVHEISYHLFKRELANAGTNKKSNSGTAYIFCAPDYGNIGDHAILEAERRFIAKHLKCDAVEVPYGLYRKVLPTLKQQINRNDTILITGGGFLGSLWFSAEAQVRSVIKEFPHNRIIILPQTIYWEEGAKWEKESEKTRAIYEEHGNLTICARDNATLELVREIYPKCGTILAPDMVLSCEWRDYFDADIERSGALLCLKADKESIVSEQDKRSLQKAAEGLCGKAAIGNTNYDYPITALTRDAELRRKLNEFRASEMVITDRLHGMIFAAVTGTPCVVLSNCNHKLRSNFEWVKDLGYIRFAESADEAEAAASEVMNARDSEYDIRLLESKYNDLIECF